jgi:hypothetical protein
MVDPFLDQGQGGNSADEEPSSSEENGFDGLHGVSLSVEWGELAPSPVD